MTSLPQIGEALARFHAYVSLNIGYCRDHPAARVSEFWATHFADRQNFPSIADFVEFRRENFVYGIGDTVPSDRAQKQREFEETAASIRLFTPTDFLTKLAEPALGAPIAFPLEDRHMSASFLLNAGTAWRIASLNERFGRRGALNVVEIGAGWGGCATQLLQTMEIASYTVVDLPENLCLSSAYLSLNNSGREARFVDCGPGPGIEPSAGLNFALPAAIDRLCGPYDLVINTMSFQEMDLDTGMTYLNWARTVLAPGGLLLSFNAHDKAGVRRASQYLVDGLKPLHMAPFRKVPAGWFNTIPYEFVFRREPWSVTETVAHGVDVLGEIMQLGIDEQATALADRLFRDEADDFTALLPTWRDFLYAPDSATRQASRSRLGETDSVVACFLVGNDLFGMGKFSDAKTFLEKSIDLGLTDFALARALVLLGAMERKVDFKPLQAAVGGLFGTAIRLVEDREIARLQDHIHRIIDAPGHPEHRAGGLRARFRQLVRQHWSNQVE
jgi:putative sugar O-methyltransferase